MLAKKIVFLIFCFCIFTQLLYSQYAIKGTVIGYDGKPMKRADIFLLSNYTRFPRFIIRSFPVNADGSFLINFKRKGMYRFRFTGVDHRDYELPVYLDQPDSVVLQVKLSVLQYKDEFKDIQFRIEYDFKTKKFKHKTKVSPDANGVYVVEFVAEDDSLEYEINGIDKNHHTVNGRQEDYFIPDGSDYLSVLKTKKDSVVKIVFDPRKLIRSQEPASYKIVHAPVNTYKFALIYNDCQKRYNDYHNYVLAGRKRGITDNDYANNYGWKKDFKELDKKIKTEKDPFLLQGWYLLRLQIALWDAWAKPRPKISRKLAEKALRAIPPDSPLWSYHPNTMPVALGIAGEARKSFNEMEKQYHYLKEYGKPYMAYINRAVATHPDSSIHKTLLRAAIAFAHNFKEFDLFDQYYKQFLYEFAGSRDVDILKARYSPERRIKPGNPVPAFTFTSFDNPKIKIDNKDLLGKNYIIDFWALWCGPCKASIEALSRIYNEFKGPDFEMISVSICFKEDDVRFFRREKLPMPWFNTHLKNWKPQQGVLHDFEVEGIPKVILIDKKGTIVEVYDLEKIIEYLRKNG